jgi:hypothetical protein
MTWAPEQVRQECGASVVLLSFLFCFEFGFVLICYVPCRVRVASLRSNHPIVTVMASRLPSPVSSIPT